MDRTTTAVNEGRRGGWDEAQEGEGRGPSPHDLFECGAGPSDRRTIWSSKGTRGVGVLVTGEPDSPTPGVLDVAAQALSRASPHGRAEPERLSEAGPKEGQT